MVQLDSACHTGVEDSLIMTDYARALATLLAEPVSPKIPNYHPSSSILISLYLKLHQLVSLLAQEGMLNGLNKPDPNIEKQQQLRLDESIQTTQLTEQV